MSILTEPSEKKAFELKSKIMQKRQPTKDLREMFQAKGKKIVQKPEAGLSLASSKTGDRKIRIGSDRR